MGRVIGVCDCGSSLAQSVALLVVAISIYASGFFITFKYVGLVWNAGTVPACPLLPCVVLCVVW